MSWTTLQDGVRQWIVALLDAAGYDCPVIWADQNGPRPALPYVTLNIIAAPRDGRDEQDMSDRGAYAEDVLETIITRRLTLSVNAVGPGALGIMYDLDDRMQTPLSLDTLESVGLSCWRTTGPQDASEMMDVGSEQRGRMDVFMGAASSVTEPDPGVGPIETVEGTGTFAGSVVEHETDFAAGGEE